jgi:peptide/nickel transport system permease protein
MFLLRGMSGLILRRIALGVLTLLLVSLVVFAATQALPGDPARAILGRDATPDALAALRAQLNLEEGVVPQYLHWLQGILTGDPGTSLAAGEPVTTLVSDRIVNSAFLVLLSALISIPLSIVIGAGSALKRDQTLDVVTSVVLLALAALPEFVVGIALVVLFGTNVFTWLPAVSLVDPNDHIYNQLDILILPTVTLVLAVVPYVSRIMRASMIEVLESDYVEMARLKGLPERGVVIRHALPNAIVPTIQVIALQLAYLAGGVVVVEAVFGYAGVGAALVDAVKNHDLPVVQFLTMLIAAIYILLNLAADIATILITPRLRTSLR